MNNKQKTAEVIKNIRRTLTVFISVQDKAWSYAVGHSCALCSSEVKSQLSSLMQHLQRNKTKCLLMVDIKEKQRSWCWWSTFAEHVMLCFVSSTVSAWHEIRWGWLCASIEQCVAAADAWGDSGEVSYDWHCSAVLHNSVGIVHKPDQC